MRVTDRGPFRLAGDTEGATTMSMHDEALSMSVRVALSGDKRISSLPIGIRVTNGDVFLKGSVDSFEQRDVAQFIVQGVSGVRHVNVDELDVKGAVNE